MRTAALVCLLLAALACVASATSSDGVLQRDTSPRRLLALTSAAPGGPLDADSTSHRKLSQSGSVDWNIGACDIQTGTIQCKPGFAVACCTTTTCTSNPDGSGGTCPSDTILGCCGKKKK